MNEQIPDALPPVAPAAPDPATPQQAQLAAAMETAKKIGARIAELKQSKGKWYRRKDGKEQPTQVLDYGGIKTHQEMRNGQPFGVNSHVFQVESLDGRRWTPPATKFLAEHDEIAAPEISNQNTQPV